MFLLLCVCRGQHFQEIRSDQETKRGIRYTRIGLLADHIASEESDIFIIKKTMVHNFRLILSPIYQPRTKPIMHLCRVAVADAPSSIQPNDPF